MKKYILIFSILFLFSCESNVTDVKLPEVNKKIVVSSFIGPGDTVKVNLSYTRPINKGDTYKIDFINNAIVSISQNIIPQTKEGMYVLPSFLISPGMTYTFNVNTPEGYSASAQCTVPVDSVPDFTITLDSLVEEHGINIFFWVEWKDNPATVDFYRVYVETEDSEGYINKLENFENRNDVISDKSLNGKTINFKTGFIYNGRFDEGNTMVRANVYLLTTDEHYYKYHESVSRWNGDSPFSEPVIIYTNIKNGLGVFGSYRKRMKVYAF